MADTDENTEKTEVEETEETEGTEETTCPGCIERDATIKALAQRNGELVAANFEHMQATENGGGTDTEGGYEDAEPETLEDALFEKVGN